MANIVKRGSSKHPYYTVVDGSRTYAVYESKAEALKLVRLLNKKAKTNSVKLKRPKLGKWIAAHRFRVVKNPAGDRVIEVQRTVKKTVRRKRR